MNVLGKILDDEHKQEPASLDDIIKTFQNLHVKEQHHLKILMSGQLQVTTNIRQTNAIIDKLHKVTGVNRMLRSYDLENEKNQENIEEQ
jgi:hypothetical protein